MPCLELDEREQWALRDLLATEPCPGSPLPTRRVLELLSVLIPADEVEATYEDRACTLTDAWNRGPLEARSALDGLQQHDELCVRFRNGSGGVVELALDRWRGEFTDRDVAMLRMLAPLLARLSRERPARLPASLTEQERHVLNHVAAGESNAEIAAALFVEPCTVRKHLENSYRKLGVTSRAAAVARLQGRDRPDLDLRERLQRLN
jgi:DNA-binding CsgD family transcriptional regulator